MNNKFQFLTRLPLPYVKSILFVLLCLAFVFPVRLHAQNWEFGANFLTGFPQSDFRQNLDATGFGLDLLALYQPSQYPVGFGIDAGIMTYGSTERREPFNPNIPEVSILVQTSHNIAIGHLFSRIQPLEGRVRPYLDLLFGFNYLYTESKIQDERNFEDIAGTTNFDDFTSSVGFGAGSKFKIAETTDPDSGNLLKVYLDVRARYLLGGDAEYIRKGSIRNENGRLAYDLDQSRTDLLSLHIGFVVQLF